MTVAEEVAAYLAERGTTHAFGIVGAGNLALFDAIARLGKTEIVCCHHEQAAVMSAAAYYRVSGIVAVAIVTTGAGSTNALTGVLSAHMDSIPLVVLAGNESSERPMIGRAIGVQGYNSAAVARPITKAAIRMTEWFLARLELESAFTIAAMERPGPVWLELPMDLAAREAA